MGEPSTQGGARAAAGGRGGTFPDAFHVTVLCMLSVLPDATGAAVVAVLEAADGLAGLRLPAGLGAGVTAIAVLAAWMPVLWLGRWWAGLSWRAAYPVLPVSAGAVPGFVVAEAGIVVVLAGLRAWGERVLPVPGLLASVAGALDGGGGGLPGHAAEELLYRGVLLIGLLRRHAPWKAILLGAALFAGTRLDPWQLPAALALGVFHGWLVAATGSLALPLAGVAIQAAAGWLVGAGLLARVVEPDGAMATATWIAAMAALLAGVGLLRLAGLRVRRPEGLARPP